ncbi:MAG: pyridoxal-phosphate dependent enzyme, partial [Halodesulfurarchaeum sp.]
MQESILGTLGSPLVRIHQDGPATVAAKVEAFNPGGSVKTRPALEMIRTAERTGKLDPGDGLVEATSGNTGIGLALVAAVRGYDLALVMPESVSTERRRLIRAYGADLHLVSGGMSDATERARRLAEREG